MYLEISHLVILLLIWIASMIHMHKLGIKTGFGRGNIVGVSQTLQLLENTGVLTKEGYEKIFKVIRK